MRVGGLHHHASGLALSYGYYLCGVTCYLVMVLYSMLRFGSILILSLFLKETREIYIKRVVLVAKQ